MQAYDNKILWDRLNELAEVFDKKPVSEKGLTVWFGVLREFPTERVCSVLIGWPKTHTKFPAPSEVWKAVNDIGIGERERKAAEENRRHDFTPGIGGAQAEKFIAQIRLMLKNPKWTPLEHWKSNLKKFPKEHIGRRYAEEALRMKNVVEQERIPGEDDEPQAVNF